MAKIVTKSEKFIPFGEIFPIIKGLDSRYYRKRFPL